jgi:hypothetical protein
MIKFTRGSDDGDLLAIETDGGRNEGDGGDSDDDDLLAYCLIFGLLLGTMLMVFIESIGGMGPAIGLLIGLAA